MSKNTGAFTKSSKTQRTPPSNPNNSSLVDPNLSTCQRCDAKDTVDMVKCDKCHKWNHFQCVGIYDEAVALAPWQCPSCDQLEQNPSRQDDNRSTRSSTSSKRRANLSLEKIAREREIQHKLAEEQNKLFEEKEKILRERAETAKDLIQREFEIRENMSDSEGDEFDNIVENREEKARTELVEDWLSNPTGSTSITAQLNNQLQNQVKQILAAPVHIPPINLRFIKPPTNNYNTPSIQDSASNSTLTQSSITQPNQQQTVTSIASISLSNNMENGSSLINQNPILNITDHNRGSSSLQRYVENYKYEPNSRLLDPASRQTLQTSIIQRSGQPGTMKYVMEQSTALQRSLDQIYLEDIIEQPSTSLHPPEPLPVSQSSVQQSPNIRNPNIQIPNEQPIPNAQALFQQPTSFQSSFQQPTISQVSNQQTIPFQDSFQQPTIHQASNPQPTHIQYFQQPSISQASSQQPVLIQGSFQQPSISQASSQQPVLIQGSFQQPSVSQASIQQPQLNLSTAQPIPIIQSSMQQPHINQSSSQNLTQGSTIQPPITQGLYNQMPVSLAYQPSINQGPMYHNQIPIVQSGQHYQQQTPTRLQIAARQTMPKELPKFKGEPEKWSIFYNAFVNGTTTCGLNNTENLSRLEKCLEDPARKAVKNLLTIPEAVPEIIATLKMMYGRPELIIDTLISQLRNERAPRMDKMETFIDFAMSVRNVTSEIQKLGMWQHLWNPNLIQELITKLPYEMRISWGEQILSTPDANLSHFSDWLFKRARSACVVTLPSSSTNRSDNKRDDKRSNSGFVHTHLKGSQPDKTTFSPKNSTNYDTKVEKGCQLCDGQAHHPSECPKFKKMSYNERWETIKAKKWCRNCLGRHHNLNCKKKTVCVEPDCTAKHHRLLHNPTKMVNSVAENASNNKTLHTAHQQNKIFILRRYIPVTLHGPTGQMNVIAFLDEGSDMTLIEENVAIQLGVDGVSEDLFLEWTSKIVRTESGSRIISLKISGTSTPEKKFDLVEVRTVKSLDLPAQTVDVQTLKNKYKFLRRIPIEGYCDATPRIIIGLIDCKLSTPSKIRSGSWNDPIAAKTLLGWEVHGAQPQSSNTGNIHLHLNHYDQITNDDDKLHKMVAQFFSLENFGVKKPEQTIEALSDKRAKQLLQSTTKNIGNKYETGLLWKYDKVCLPDSLPMAKRRLISLNNRFRKDLGLAMKFRSKLAEYIEKGYVRKLTDEEADKTTPKTWYLPLFPVIYPKKPNKIRPVWDAAAKVGEISLNSMLLSGPDQLVSLPGVLLRYREGKYAITGDIREMFHQIQIIKDDQNSQRFIWKEEGSTKIDTYILQVMSFGATCSPSSAQYIKNYNALQFKEQYPAAEKAIRENHYVDDWLQSFDTQEQVIQVAKEVKYVHSMGGFEIRNWVSNSSEIMFALGESVNSTEQKVNIDLDESLTERILGMWWNVSTDTFTYSLRYNPLNKDVLTGAQRPTKREVLRTLMCVYDPLGFLAAYLVHLKMLLQDIWRSGIGWDEKLSEKDDDDLYNRWLNWIKHLPDIEKIQIPRHYSSKLIFSKPPSIELHIFVDASELAYACVAYLRIEDEYGVDVCLVGGKTKVAPIKPLSIPRMELQAALLGTRYRNSIHENQSFQISRTVMWSDSYTVLSWLRSDLRKYSQYVGTRIAEILESTVVPEWRWIPSKMNLADDATKWKGSFHLDADSRWFKGPDFLLQPEQSWIETKPIIDETNEEIKPKHLHVHNKVEIELLPIKFEEFPRWVRTIAFALRFVNNVKAKIGKTGFTFKKGLLTREELLSAENALYRKAQLDHYKYDIQVLKENQESSNGRRTKRIYKTSALYKFSPYLDSSDVLRVRGRIDAAPNATEDQKRPIILPTKHQITNLIVKEYHCKFVHRNSETVINEIKQKFIILRLRALLKRIRRECQFCKNARVMPVPPQMADLPIGRLSSFTRVFTYVGIDYSGPMYVSVNRREVKRWLVLFTCLTIRAVHIEYAHSLNTDSCIMAITRFTKRRGPVLEFFSDQGTNFKGCDNELNREIQKIDQELLNEKFTTLYTKWNFNPPLSQHMGGAWERLIGSMKITLEAILPKTRLPNDETLTTALAEVENIINSRPLTYVSLEPDDPEALTPNHFLLGSSNGTKPPGIFPPIPKVVRGNWRYAQQIADSFWHRWVKEYLPVITRRTKWFDDIKPIEVDDQVIIVDEDSPRNTWTRGVVIEANKSERSGRVNQVKVRTVKNIYTRPVTKLAILDIKKPEAKPLTHEDLAEGSVTASDKKMG